LAILADIEPGLPARRKRLGKGLRVVNPELPLIRTLFPGGKMPPSTAGTDARRHISKWLVAFYHVF
jgi:hypothetical protein